MKRITKIYAFFFAFIMALSLAPALSASAIGNQYLLIDLITKRKVDIASCSISVSATVSYTGKAVKPKIVIKHGNTTLEEGKHYTTSYSSNKKIGTGAVTITGVEKNGYKNSKTYTFKIVPKEVKISVKDKSTTTFTLSWKKVKGAKKYIVYKYDSKKKKYTKVTTTSKTTYTAKKLSSGKKYIYAVVSYAKKDFTSDYSKITVYTNPSAVKKVTAKASDTTTTLSWKKVTRATGYVIYKYNSKKKKYTKVATTKKTTYTIRNLATKTSYKYAVAAYTSKTTNVGNKKTVSFKTSALIPLGKVTGLKASSKDNVLTLTWKSTNKAEGYLVYTYDAKGKEVLIGTVSTNSFTSGRPEGTTEKYSVRAYKMSAGKKIKGKSSAKITVNIPLDKVKGLKAKAISSDSVILEWEKKDKAEGYKLYFYDEAKKQYTLISDTGSKTTFEVKGLKNYTKYNFAVSAYITVNGKKTESTYSDAISVLTAKAGSTVTTTAPDSTTKPSTESTTKAPEATTAPGATTPPSTTAPSVDNTTTTAVKPTEKPATPGAPATISLDDRTETSITIKWSAIRNVDYYNVYLYDSATNTFTKLGTSEANTYTANNLQKGKAYSFSVTAVRKYYEGDIESEKAYPASFSTFPAPAKVTGVNAAVDGGKATVSWKSVTDADGYTVYSVNPSDGSLKSLGLVSDKAQLTFDMAEGTAHTVCVKAYVKSKSAFLEGPASESIYVIRPFSKVANLKVVSNTEYSVTLSWDKKNGAEGYDISVYDPETKLFSQILDAGNNTTFSVKNLTDNQTYTFAVGAYFIHDNQKISGSLSDNVSVKTNTYVKPSNISITAYTTSSMTIKWQTISDAKGYNVYSYNSDTREYTLLGTSRFALFNASGLEANKKYSYAVSVVKYENGKDIEGNKSDIVTAYITTEMPQNLKNAYSILRSNCFSMKYAMPVSGAQSIPTEYYYKNGNFALVASMSMEGMDFSSRTLYLKDKNEAYILIPMGITGFYAKMSASDLKNEGMDANSLILSLAPDVNTAIPYTVTNKKYDGKDYTCETFVASNGSIITYFFHNGNLTDIEETSKNGQVSHMSITSLSPDVNDKIFKLPSLFPLGWTKVDV